MVSPEVTSPEPYRYCFKLQARNCSLPTSKCCKTSNIATFLLNVGPLCEYEILNATLNGRSVPGVVIGAPKEGFGTSSVLTVPGLKLNATSLGSAGAQLCLDLPREGQCGSVDRLAVANWTAALVSSDAKCCPINPVHSAPGKECETCWVWDVVGPDGTAASSKWDFLSRNSCSLASLPAEHARNFTNCCQFYEYWYAQSFYAWRDEGLMKSGFDTGTCTRTSLRMCGTLASESAGQAVAADRNLYGGLREAFDNTDDTCPMALIDNNVRLRSVLPGNGTWDTRCTPVNETVEKICWQPDISYAIGPEDPPFPNDSCQTGRGITPFKVDPYYDVQYGNTTNTFCISIGATTPLDPKSKCGKTTRIDRISFGIFDDDWRREYYRGVYLLTKEGSKYKRKNLTTSWAPEGDRTYLVTSLGLDLTTVKAKSPKICIVRDNEGMLWFDTIDGMGYLWTALYDSSGDCCPLYYANRF